MPRRPAFRPSPRRAPLLHRVAPRPRARTVYALRGGIRREERSVLFGGARRLRIGQALVAMLVLALGAGVAVAMASPMQEQQQSSQEPQPEPTPVASPTPEPAEDGEAQDQPIQWRESRALGLPYWRGRLRNGVKLPPEGRDYFTWDPVLRRSPNRPWRRYGTDDLVRVLLQVLREHRTAFPEAPRVGIGDLSRPRGGEFGVRYGGLGHMSHQNGLDVDVYYPRWDGLERRPPTPDLVDEDLSQDLVDRFVAVGAEKVFVGPRLSLKGPRRIVVKLVHHDDHLHVRLRKPAD